MKNLLILLFVLSSFQMNAQTWENLEFDSIQSGLEFNPLKGFSTMFKVTNNFPHSIRGRLFGLDDLMTGLNDFDWSLIDSFLEEESAKGNHCYIQVNIDPAKGETDMPEYLFDLVDTFYYDGNHPDDEGGVADICPDWNDPDLMAAMLNFIDSFGVRYNDDPRIFLVHLGLYGMWGEWHIGFIENLKPEFDMTEENKTIIANAYTEAFPDQNLLARYPENMPDPQMFGYSDGLFFGQSIGDNPFFFHNILKASHSDEAWKLHPIGGEVDPDLQASLWDVWPNVVGQDLQASMDSTHPTWLFSNHHFNHADMAEGSDEWNNSIRTQKLMGYTFYLDQYNLSASGGKPAFEVNVRNTGIAPMYANWDVEFAAINSSDELKILGRQKWNLNLIQPDVGINYRSFISDSTLTDDTYTFLLRIVNPIDAFAINPRPVKFANMTQDNDMDGWITLGDKTIMSGSVGTIPTALTGISLSPDSATIQKGETLLLTAQILPINASNQQITWVSDHPGSVSVDTNGLVTTGTGYGTATITAFTNDGGYEAKSVITNEPYITIPAKIQAEHFVENFGFSVEIENNPVNLGNSDIGDSLLYGVRVDSSSSFIIDFAMASGWNPGDNGQIAIIDTYGDTLDIVNGPFTNWNWHAYDTVSSQQIYLPIGTHDLRLVAIKNGFNLDWIEFKIGGTLPATYTFLGTTNDQYSVGSNWDAGVSPPNGFGGTINIQSDCIIPNNFGYRMGKQGTLIISENVTLSIK